jgi:hypothetical protein
MAWQRRQPDAGSASEDDVGMTGSGATEGRSGTVASRKHRRDTAPPWQQSAHNGSATGACNGINRACRSIPRRASRRHNRGSNPVATEPQTVTTRITGNVQSAVASRASQRHSPASLCLTTAAQREARTEPNCICPSVPQRASQRHSRASGQITTAVRTTAATMSNSQRNRKGRMGRGSTAGPVFGGATPSRPGQ